MPKSVYWPPELVALPTVRPLRSTFVDCATCRVTVTV